MTNLDVRLKKWMKQEIEGLLEQIKHNDFMSKKHKKTCRYLNYYEYLLILTSAVTGCVSISSGFILLIDIPVGIKNSAVQLKICVITSGIKKYQSVIKKNSKKNDKTLLLGKAKLNTNKFLKFLIMTNLFQLENMLGEHNKLKEE